MKKILLSLLAFSALQVHAQIPTNGLSVYYNFNGNLNDESGNGYNPQLNGTVSYESSNNWNQLDSTVKLNGVNSEIYLDYTGNETDFESQDYTCVAKIRLDTIKLYNNIFEIGDAASTSIYFRLFRLSDSTFRLQAGNYDAITATGTNAEAFGCITCNDSVSLNINPKDAFRIYAVTSSYNTTTQIRTTSIYIDGVLLGTQNFTSGLINFSNVSKRMSIANRFNVNTPAFKSKGNLDYFMYYNRALDSLEMALIIGADPVLETNQISQSETKIYPNPSNGEVTITSTQIGGTIKIADATGRIVSSNIISKENTSIDLSENNSGVYFVSITGTDGSSSTKKLIVRK
jgi:hypothetical protein